MGQRKAENYLKYINDTFNWKNCKSTGVDFCWDKPLMGTIMLSMSATWFSSSREILTCPLSRYWKELWEMSRKLNKISVFLIVSGSLYGRTSTAGFFLWSPGTESSWFHCGLRPDDLSSISLDIFNLAIRGILGNGDVGRNSSKLGCYGRCSSMIATGKRSFFYRSVNSGESVKSWRVDLVRVTTPRVGRCSSRENAALQVLFLSWS